MLLFFALKETGNLHASTMFISAKNFARKRGYGAKRGGSLKWLRPNSIVASLLSCF